VQHPIIAGDPPISQRGTELFPRNRPLMR